MVILTRAQRGAVKRAWARLAEDTRPPFRAFRASVQLAFGCDGAVVVPWCGMWLCIERDGYTHS
jgi:hypothetical protein